MLNYQKQLLVSQPWGVPQIFALGLHPQPSKKLVQKATPSPSEKAPAQLLLPQLWSLPHVTSLAWHSQCLKEIGATGLAGAQAELAGAIVKVAALLRSAGIIGPLIAAALVLMVERARPSVNEYSPWQLFASYLAVDLYVVVVAV
jgi:hypothetical protein